MSKTELLTVKTLTPEDAQAAGYRRIELPLGGGLSLSLLAANAAVPNVFSSVDKVETPGRMKMATLFEPTERDVFATTVTVFAPGFAAEAPAASEQLLFEGGYRRAAQRHQSLVVGDSLGVMEDGGQIARGARSYCETRGEHVVCFLMEFDAEHEAAAIEQAAVMVGSLTFKEDDAAGFADAQLRDLVLPLAPNEQLTLRVPTTWTIAENDFKTGMPGAVQLHDGDEASPRSVMVVTASEGGPPPGVEAIDAVADKMVAAYVDANAELLANPQRALVTALRGFDGLGRSYAYVVDKRKGEEGQAQIKLTLASHRGVRYAVQLLTHYSEGVDDSSQFFARWSGTTAYDLALEALVDRLKAD